MENALITSQKIQYMPAKLVNEGEFTRGGEFLLPARLILGVTVDCYASAPHPLFQLQKQREGEN